MTRPAQAWTVSAPDLPIEAHSERVTYCECHGVGGSRGMLGASLRVVDGDGGPVDSVYLTITQFLAPGGEIDCRHQVLYVWPEDVEPLAQLVSALTALPRCNGALPARAVRP
jgi:hypothetical protein